MNFLTIEQLAAELRVEGESIAQVVMRIRKWKAACPDFPYYQGRKNGKIRFILSEVADWLRRQTVASRPAEVYDFANPRPSMENHR